MLQVHVVTAANASLYSRQMDVCFRWRHRIYVEEKHWRDPQPDGREVDQFDTDEATYLLAFKDNGFVAASRLRPFSAPTLLGEVFPQLASGRGVPTGAHEAEWTRMFVVPGMREKGHRGVAAAMCCAVMEYCVDEGIARIGGIQETYWLPRWADYGWRVEVLGLPQDVDGTPCVAALFEAGAWALEGAQKAAGVRAPQIVRVGPDRSFVTGTVRAPLPDVASIAPSLANLPGILQ